MILDTNALSGFAKGEAAVAEKIRRAKVIAVPVVAVGEYRFGIAQSRFRTEFEQWLLELLAASRLLLVDAETAAHYAGVRLELKRAGTPIPVNDCWIAALCRQHALPVLSQDRHFDRVAGLTRIGW